MTPDYPNGVSALTGVSLPIMALVARAEGHARVRFSKYMTAACERRLIFNFSKTVLR